MDDELYPAQKANVDAAKDLLRTNIKGLAELTKMATTRLALLPPGSPIYGEVKTETQFLATQLEFNRTLESLLG